VWRGGADAADPVRLDTLRQALAPLLDPASDAVKAQLRAATDVAISRGVFGVPTFELDGRLYWGLDALPMLRASLQRDPWFEGTLWDAAAAPRPHVERARRD
jgi:hypothetical protein